MSRLEKIRTRNSLLLEEVPEYRQQAAQFAEDMESQRRLRRSLIRFEPGILLPCIALGFSPCLMQITENLVAVCFNVSLLKYAGNTAVGAVTILCTIMNFTMLLLTGMTQGAQPILSYNAGAGNAGRVKETFRMVLFSCTVGSVLIWAFCMFGNELLAGIFTNDAGLLAYTAAVCTTSVCFYFSFRKLLRSMEDEAVE